ncbi:MAG: iron-sulfur cluster assembly scaffold protein [Desulfobacterales bacterium]|nr:iron-sulfur cluster assembly scaffold protein [Desulfobacterales bacterium]
MNQDDLNNHSPEFLEMAYIRDHVERLHHPDAYGKRIGDCGDIVEFYLLIDRDRIKHISFTTQGCLNTVACSNTVVKLVQNQSLKAAWDVTPEDVIDYLKSLPEDHHHCAELSVGALYLALADYKKRPRRSS